jgi:hypothetical protein
VCFFPLAVSFRDSIIGRDGVTFASNKFLISLTARIAEETIRKSVCKDIAERFCDEREPRLQSFKF